MRSTTAAEGALIDETIQDAGDPLEIKWYSGSYLDLPVSKR